MKQHAHNEQQATVPTAEQLHCTLTEMSPAVAWADIGGLADVKLRLQRAVEWPLTQQAAFKRLGLKAPRGVLLHGPPGAYLLSSHKPVVLSLP